jgi:hypothetical protein
LLVGIVVSVHFTTAILHDNAIAPCQDLHSAIENAIVHLGLRNQPGNLSAYRDTESSFHKARAP